MPIWMQDVCVMEYIDSGVRRQRHGSGSMWVSDGRGPNAAHHGPPTPCARRYIVVIIFYY